MNKKLFKGALVLFASIFMAVSCQSNSNPDGGGTNKPNGPGTPEKPQQTPLSVSLKTSDTETGKLVEDKLNVASSGNDKILEFTGASGDWEADSGPTGNITITLEGADLGELNKNYVFGKTEAGDKTKRIKVTKVEGVAPTAYDQNTTLKGLNINLSAGNSFGSVTGDNATSYFVITAVDASKIKLVPQASLSTALKGANKLNEANHGGVIKITLEVSDISNTKSPVELVIYSGVKRKTS